MLAFSSPATREHAQTTTSTGNQDRQDQTGDQFAWRFIAGHSDPAIQRLRQSPLPVQGPSPPKTWPLLPIELHPKREKQYAICQAAGLVLGPTTGSKLPATANLAESVDHPGDGTRQAPASKGVCRASGSFTEKEDGSANFLGKTKLGLGARPCMVTHNLLAVRGLRVSRRKPANGFLCSGPDSRPSSLCGCGNLCAGCC
jgi:hypothetical protein